MKISILSIVAMLLVLLIYITPSAFGQMSVDDAEKRLQERAAERSMAYQAATQPTTQPATAESRYYQSLAQAKHDYWVAVVKADTAYLADLDAQITQAMNSHDLATAETLDAKRKQAAEDKKHDVEAMNSISINAGPWNLVWSDEFDHPGLPDSAKWSFREGLINNQDAYFTRDRMDNVRVENRTFVIEARKEHFANANYTSGQTVTIKKWQYGRFETRAKFPSGSGLMSLIEIHTIDSFHAAGGAIHISFFGDHPDEIHCSVAYSVNGKFQTPAKVFKTQAPSNDFHTYAVEWSSDRIDFIFDDTKCFTFNVNDAGIGADNPFRKPMFLGIGLRLGGDDYGPIDDSILPQQLLVKYVRVYRPAAAPGAQPETQINAPPGLKDATPNVEPAPTSRPSDIFSP